MRVGIGYDVHQLRENRKLFLGGVQLESEMGLEGHSDADILIHAIMDALLGAAGLGDIGIHFPNNDMRYKDISSLVLLAEVASKVKEAGFRIINIDSMIVMERPKLSPYFKQMCRNIAQALEIELSCVNVKATTSEGLGFCGRTEGASAQAIALIE